jgi:DNA-binding MarR family transcriptional regulator
MRAAARHESASAEAITSLVLEVFRLNGRLLATGDRMMADMGLTSARWQVLGAIALAGARLPVAHIAHDMGLSRQAVQRLVNEMAADGLVSFADNPRHRRARLVVLTARGQAVFEEAMGRQEPWAQDLGAGMEASELATAARVLRAVTRRLEADRVGTAPHSPPPGRGEVISQEE